MIMPYKGGYERQRIPKNGLALDAEGVEAHPEAFADGEEDSAAAQEAKP